ncbi:Inner membrane ABC transporter permease protein YcjP [subsurface metagenome]
METREKEHDETVVGDYKAVLMLGIKGALMRFTRKLLNRRALLYLILILFAVFFLLPIWGALTTSLKTPFEVDTTSPLFPALSPTFSPYVDAFNALKTPLFNSLLITTGGVIGSVVLGSVVGYIFSKVRFKHDTWVFLILIIGIFLPYQSVIIPLYSTVLQLGLFAKIPGLVLVHTAYGIPICALLFRNFYAEIPDSVIKQAKMDGAGTWRIYRRIVLPTTVLATVAVVVFQFTSIWNDFLFGLILGGAEGQAMPVTVALSNLTGTYAALWNVQMAGAIMVSLPVLVLYIFLGKYLVRGYMAGAISGS